MIFGECPYDDCKESFTTGIAPQCPAFQKHVCEKCKRTIWTYHSRLDPHSYTEEGFNEKYKVDEETKHIEEK